MTDVTTRSSRAAPLLLGLCLAFVLAACGVSGTVNATSGKATASTTPGSTSTSPVAITIAELEAILPTTSDVGRDYEVVRRSGDPGSDTADEAMERVCPASDGLLNEQSDGQQLAEVTMRDAEGRGVQVTLNPRANTSFDDENLDDLIDAVNGCDTITYSADGWDYAIDVRIARTDDIGDVAITSFVDLTLDTAELEGPIEVGYYVRTFVVGTVTITVSTMDGTDNVTYETIPRDEDLVDEISAEMETRVTDLLAG